VPSLTDFITRLSETRAAAALTRVYAACFGVHCFAARTIVNSPLYCWALGGERSGLWKSLHARSNRASTHAIDASVVHRIKLSGKNLLRILFVCHGNEQGRTGQSMLASSKS
jgi:hypothetical protein